MLAISNLSFFYHKNEILTYGTHLFRDITIISGPSGRGKSTLFHLISRTFLPQTGAIFWNNENIENFEKDIYYKEVLSLVTQDAHLSPYFTLREYIALIQYLYKKTDTNSYEQTLVTLGLETLLDQHIGSCSGGQKYRINLFLALLKDTPLLCLDEPTAHLDDENKNKMITVLEEKKQKTILIISHDPDLQNRPPYNYFTL